MDNSFPQGGSGTQQRSRVQAGLRILDRLENWLARLVEMTLLTKEEQFNAGIRLEPFTEEEQRKAGIYQADSPSE